jgi:xanthine/uracil permease
VRALPVQVMAQVIMVVGMQLYGIIVNRFAMLYAPPQV